MSHVLLFVPLYLQQKVSLNSCLFLETHTSFALLNSQYMKKKQFFGQEKKDKTTKNVLQAVSAHDLLGAATRV
jgi:hypothetical protein